MGSIQSRTIYFELKLEWDGIELLVTSDKTGERGEIAFVKVGSFRLMRDGHKKCWDDARWLAEDLGLHAKDNLVARADICVDLPGVDVQPFCEAYARRDIIARARSGGLFDEGIGYTGFSRGKDGLMVRVYDKLTEAQKKADDAKFDVLMQRRWGGVVPPAATRVEFQIRRRWLATWHTLEGDGMRGEVRTVDDLFNTLPTITRYLVEHWFRIVDDAQRHREHGNQARAKVSELWGQVCEAFASWVEGEVVELVRKATGSPDDERLLKQLNGVIASLAAATPQTFTKAREALAYAMSRVDAVCGDGLLEKIRKRRGDLEASGRARYLGVPLEPLVGQKRITYEEHEALAVCFDDLPF